MGVRIGNYEGVTSTPNALIQAGNNPVARPVDPTAAVGVGLQALGRGLGDVADAFTHKDNADGISRAGKVASDLSIEADQKLEELKKNAPNGADGMTGEFTKWYDARTAELIAAEPNQKGQLLLQQHFSSTRTSLAKQSINYEAQAGVAYRDQNVEATYQNYARLVSQGKMTYEQAQEAMDTVFANIGYDPVTRADRAKRYRERLSETYWTGKTERDPAQVKGVMQGVYQAKNLTTENAAAITDTAKRLGVSPADLQAIISYETGGTFDPSMRGGKNNKHIGLIQFGENEQKAYGANQQQSFVEQMGAVERYLKARGVRPGDDLKTLYKIVNGGSRDVADTASDGNGTIAEHVEKIRTKHGGGVAMSADDRAALRNMNVDRVPTFLNHAESEVNRQQAVYRSQLETQVANQTALLMNGESVQNPPSEQQFIQAYGESDGRYRFSQFMQISQLGGDIANLKTMPLDKQQELLALRKPDPKSPDYALAVKRYDTLVEATNKLNESRVKDPMAYAQNAKIGDVQPINWNDTTATGNELRKRVGVAQTLNRDYGAPLAVLTQREAQNLTAGLQNMTAREKLNYLGTIQANVTDPAAYRAIMQQIAPDSPVTAMAGMILNKSNPSVQTHWFSSNDVFTQSDVAAKLLKGEALLNPNKASKGEDGKSRGFQMPKETDMRSQFANQMGKAFADHPEAADIAYQAVKAYYAAASSEAGDISGNLDSTRLDKAIAAVTGKPTNVNGNGEVIRPWGMDESTFNNTLKQKFTQAMKDNGLSGTQVDNWGLYGVQPVGDGLYAVRMGTGYLNGKDGRRIVLDLTTPPSKVSLIPIGDGLAQATPAPAVPQRAEKAQPMTTTAPKTK